MLTRGEKQKRHEDFVSLRNNIRRIFHNGSYFIYAEGVNFIKKHLLKKASVFFGGDEEKAGCKQPLVHRERFLVKRKLKRKKTIRENL